MSKWTIPIGKLAALAKADVERVGRAATFKVFNAVQLRSPVDTGRFRANWMFGAGAIPGGISASVDPGGALAQAQAMQALTTPLGGIVYFANNLPYARRLEYGWSQQAPAGMVRISVTEFTEHVRSAIAS